MRNKAIITGAHGFLGRRCAEGFSAAGYDVHGIGHGGWPEAEYSKYGIKTWISADITYEALCSIGCGADIDAVVHCGGGSSVAYSVEHPSLDFRKTVESTLAVLEFIRRENPGARLVYPSSTAVYGAACADERISEGRALNPVSPYGFHKAAAELLCESYHRNYGVKCSIIRFFSLYGEGLTKQLLWDACNKIANAPEGSDVEFFGTGNETRDWLHVSDAVGLMLITAASTAPFDIVNGGSGVKTTIAETLALIVKSFEKLGRAGCGISFRGAVKPGDPAHYWADTSRAEAMGWSPRVAFPDGAARYVEWFLAKRD